MKANMFALVLSGVLMVGALMGSSPCFLGLVFHAFILIPADVLHEVLKHEK